MAACRSSRKTRFRLKSGFDRPMMALIDRVESAPELARRTGVGAYLYRRAAVQHLTQKLGLQRVHPNTRYWHHTPCCKREAMCSGSEERKGAKAELAHLEKCQREAMCSGFEEFRSQSSTRGKPQGPDCQRQARAERTRRCYPKRRRPFVLAPAGLPALVRTRLDGAVLLVPPTTPGR